jgi:K+-sensing histidine kinase KdpD
MTELTGDAEGVNAQPDPRPDHDDEVEPAGHFRLYLGAAAGVGKTYAMLNEAHRRKQRGTDVVIGFVECHGRRNTEELIGDLEAVPRRSVEYRGTVFEEMDLDALGRTSWSCSARGSMSSPP